MLALRWRFLLALSASLLWPVSVANAHAGDATGFASITIRDTIVSYTLTPTPASQTDPALLAQLLHDKLTVTADGKRCLPAGANGLTAVFT